MSRMLWIADHNFAFQGQNPQQFQRRLVFVSFGIDAYLGQYRRDRRSVSRDQVLSGHLALATAPQGLAIERDVFVYGGFDTPLDPTRQDGFEVRGIEATERAAERRCGRGFAASETQGVSQRGSVLSSESGDALNTTAQAVITYLAAVPVRRGAACGD